MSEPQRPTPPLGTSPAGSQATLEEIAHAVGHDVRAPLRAIRMATTMLREDCSAGLTAECREHLAIVEERAEALDRMLQTVVEFCRAGRGIEPSRIDLASACRSIADAIERPAGVVVDCTVAIADVVCSKSVTTIVRELVDNAVRHLGRDSGTVEVTAASAGDELRLSVRDDGPGIAAVQRERVVRLFGQPPRGGNQRGRGLALVRRLAELAGGALTIRERDGGGTEVEVTLPTGSPQLAGGSS